MTLLLSETDVLSLLSMKETVGCVETCFANMNDQLAENFPRTRAKSPTISFQVMFSMLPYIGKTGAKLYTAGRGGEKFAVLLFDVKTGELLSVMGASNLGKYRTGAASGVATKHLTNLKSFKLAIAGTGGQALTQVTAQIAVANVEKVSVWSPHREHREDFVRELSREFGLDGEPADSVDEAFRRADVATAITTSREPFITRKVAEGLRHLNLCGANRSERAELSTDALGLFDTIVVDDRRQAKSEARELIEAVAQQKYSWEDFVELKDVVQSKAKPGDKTLFKSLGIAAEDVALATFVYEKALKSGRFANQQFNFH